MSVPFTFVNGTTADATQVNANFAAVLALTGGTLTGPLILNGAATFNAVATFNFPVTVNAVLTLGSTLSVPSITYPGTEGHNIAFGWDGSRLIAHVDGTGNPGALAAWNSNVDLNFLTTNGLQVNGNVGITGTTSCSTINTGGGAVITSGLQVNGNVNIGGVTNCLTLNTGPSGITTSGLTVNGGVSITAGGTVGSNWSIGGVGSVGGIQFYNNAGFFYSPSNIRSSGFTSDGNIDAAGNIVSTGGNLFSANDTTAPGVFRRSPLGGAKGAGIECWGGDWDFMSFAESGGNLLISPDRGSSGFFFISSGSFSDATLKDNITNTSVDALAAITATPVRSFDWNAEGLKRQPEGTPASVPIGFVAQELQAHVPGSVVVNKMDGDLLIVDHAKLVPYLARAIQQQQDLIEQLTQRIAALEAKA